MSATIGISHSPEPHHESNDRGSQNTNALENQNKHHLHLVRSEGQLKVHTSPYRGSFSVVLSEALRSAGLGSNVMITQFLKGGVKQGTKGCVQLCDRLTWLRPNIENCINQRPEGNSLENHELNAIQEIWQFSKEALLGGKLDQIILDEVGLAISLGYVNEFDFLSTLEARPKTMDVIMTGPSIPSRIMNIADQVTELRTGY